MADYKPKPMIFPEEVPCLTPGCEGRAEPIHDFRCGAVGLAIYCCDECASLTVIAQAPMAIDGVYEASYQGKEYAFHSLSLIQKHPVSFEAFERP